MSLHRLHPSAGTLLSDTSHVPIPHTKLVKLVESAPVVNPLILESLTKRAMQDTVTALHTDADTAARLNQTRLGVIDSIKDWLSYVNGETEDENAVPQKTIDPIRLAKANSADAQFDHVLTDMLDRTDAPNYECESVKGYIFRMATQEPEYNLIGQITRREVAPIVGYLALARRATVHYDLSFSGFEI